MTMAKLGDAELRLMGHEPAVCECDLCLPPNDDPATVPRCGFTVAGETGPCGMPLESAGGGRWRHEYRAVDRDHRADFMECQPGHVNPAHATAYYDRVIMNPPFSQEVRHVLHAHRFLRAGGLLVAVMSAGVQFRADRATFREFVSRRGGSITALPDDSFASSGTNVRTVIVTIPAEVVTG